MRLNENMAVKTIEPANPVSVNGWVRPDQGCTKKWQQKNCDAGVFLHRREHKFMQSMRTGASLNWKSEALMT